MRLALTTPDRSIDNATNQPKNSKSENDTLLDQDSSSGLEKDASSIEAKDKIRKFVSKEFTLPEFLDLIKSLKIFSKPKRLSETKIRTIKTEFINLTSELDSGNFKESFDLFDLFKILKNLVWVMVYTENSEDRFKIIQGIIEMLEETIHNKTQLKYEKICV